MKIYISGKITGEAPEEWKAKFEAAELKIVAAGVSEANIVSPRKLPIPEDASWDDAMRECVLALSGCTAVFILRDWKESQGARHEVMIAAQRGMLLYWEESNDITHLKEYISAGII